jgi:uncharacterized protein YkwD
MANWIAKKTFAAYSTNAMLFALGLLGFMSVMGSDVAAQALDARPVARLISAGPIYPRTRRVEPRLNSRTATTATPSLADANDIERRAFEETNRLRVRSGFAPLAWDPDLCRLARSHSQKMAQLGYFSHVDPDGARLRDRARAFGIEHFSVLGENIAYNLGYDDPGGFAVERWMASADHRANLLSPEFHDMAIGTFVAADGSVYLTQIFITR